MGKWVSTLIGIDNVLWGERVLDDDTQAILALNRLVENPPVVDIARPCVRHLPDAAGVRTRCDCIALPHREQPLTYDLSYSRRAAPRNRHNPVMVTKPNIFLVGMMASGKTTIGRQLAALLHLDFHDTDQLVEECTGADISWIFDMEGEAGFRDREQQAIDDATAMAGVVVATGGGAVLRDINRQRLRERGTVVYLDASAELILERVRYDRRRPLLQAEDVEQRIDKLCRQREPLYRAAAHIVVAAGRRPARIIAASVARQLAGHVHPAAADKARL